MQACVDGATPLPNNQFELVCKTSSDTVETGLLVVEPVISLGYFLAKIWQHC